MALVFHCSLSPGVCVVRNLAVQSQASELSGVAGRSAKSALGVCCFSSCQAPSPGGFSGWFPAVSFRDGCRVGASHPLCFSAAPSEEQGTGTRPSSFMSWIGVRSVIFCRELCPPNPPPTHTHIPWTDEKKNHCKACLKREGSEGCL